MEKWIPKSRKVYLDWVLRVKQEGWHKLNDWEVKFCESIYERLFIREQNLTHAQADKLETIYTEKTK